MTLLELKEIIDGILEANTKNGELEIFSNRSIGIIPEIELYKTDYLGHEFIQINYIENN